MQSELAAKMKTLGLFLVLAALGGGCAADVGNFPRVGLGYTVAPVGNPPTTQASLSVEGTTNATATREYMVNFGLVSNKGTGYTTPQSDKVCLYTGIVGNSGTGDIWSINPLLTQSPESGAYNAQGIELDFNNQNAHRGDEDAGAGLAAPVSYGLSVTGASAFRSTSAMLVCGKSKTWNRGACAPHAKLPSCPAAPLLESTPRLPPSSH